MSRYIDIEKVKENAIFPYLGGNEEKQRIYRQGFYHALEAVKRTGAVDNIELKPCPFCGGKAMFIKDDDNPSEWCWVRCLNCRCHTKMFDTPTDAAVAWNRRAAEC